MKPFKLREQKTFIKILKEPVQKKKKINWSRWIYIGIFLVILSLFMKRILKSKILILANGQIELPKQTVTFPNDIKVLNLFVDEGIEICQGDTLFSYKISGDEIDKAKMSYNSVQPNDWIDREKLSLSKNIKLNKINIANYKKTIDHYDKAINEKEELILNGMHNYLDEVTQLEEAKSLILVKIDLLKSENGMLISHLSNLRAQSRQKTNLHSESLALYNQVQYFTSPSDGVIGDIYYSNNEICYKKSEMLTLHKLSNATISTYFDPTELKYLAVGDEVNIHFPDKTESTGLISKFFVSTYALPSEFQKKYEPTERNIVAEVVPITNEHKRVWNNYYKMDVIIKKSRYPVWDFLEQL